MIWAVEIQKTGLELRNLVDLLFGLGFRVISSDPYPVLTSNEIDKCATPAEVHALARQVQAAMTGPACIDPEFRLGSVLDCSWDPPKRHAVLEPESLFHQHTVGTPTLKIGAPEGLSESQLIAWHAAQADAAYQKQLESQRTKLVPAFRNRNAAKLLRLLSNAEPTGETLYKIYELIEGHPNNRQAVQQQLGISSEEFRHFQDAVHNPRVTGDWARHAYDRPPRTNAPWSKTEAEDFVRRIALQWLMRIRDE